MTASSLVALQTLRVRRLYDEANNTLLYVAYSTRLDGSQNVGPADPLPQRLTCETPTCSQLRLMLNAHQQPASCCLT